MTLQEMEHDDMVQWLLTLPDPIPNIEDILKHGEADHLSAEDRRICEAALKFLKEDPRGRTIANKPQRPLGDSSHSGYPWTGRSSPAPRRRFPHAIQWQEEDRATEGSTEGLLRSPIVAGDNEESVEGTTVER